MSIKDRSPENHPVPFIEKIGEGQNGEPSYMVRLHLTPFRWWRLPRVYIHVLGRGDNDREHHDHPWGFWTLVLFGGYEEIAHEMGDDGVPTHTGYVEDTLRFLSLRYRPATHAHRITKLLTKRVVTFVLRDNTKQRDWGFWCRERIVDGRKVPFSRQRWVWVPWRQYHGVV